MKQFFGLVLVTLLGVACGKNSSVRKDSDTSPESAPPVSSDARVEEETHSTTDIFLGLVNRHRHKLGLDPLLLEPVLSEVAYGHSEAMGKRHVPFGHMAFSSRCKRIRSEMGMGNLCGENVAMGQKSAQTVYKAWMNSPGHRHQIESERFTHMGLGFYQTRSGVIYWTQLFLEIP